MLENIQPSSIHWSFVQGLKWWFPKNPEIQVLVILWSAKRVDQCASALLPKNWGFGGRSEPPMGSRCEAPEIFWHFLNLKRQENPFLRHAEERPTDNWEGKNTRTVPQYTSELIFHTSPSSTKGTVLYSKGNPCPLFFYPGKCLVLSVNPAWVTNNLLREPDGKI